MEVEVISGHGQPGSSSSEVAVSIQKPVPVARSARPSSPEFPAYPSPDMPPWLSKCVRLLTLNTEEAQDEIGRMLDEALQRRDRSDEVQAAAHVSMIKKPDSKPAAGKPGQVKRELGKKTALTSKPSSGPPALKKTKPNSPPPAAKGMSSPEYPAPHEIGSSESGSSAMDVVSSGTSGGVPGGEAEETADLSELFSSDELCVICSGNSQSAGDRLLECQECHKLFHQLCHNPPVTDPNAQDPRFVWYCEGCKRKLKKAVARPDIPVSKPPSAAPVVKQKQHSVPVNQPAVVSSGNGNTSADTLFTRRVMEPKTTTASSKGVGLGGLALLKPAKGIPVSREEKPDSRSPTKRIKLLDDPFPKIKTRKS